MPLQHQMSVKLNATANATEPTSRIFALFFRWVSAPVLVARRVMAGEIPGGGIGGALVMCTGDTAAPLIALFPALALARISMLARSSGVMDGEAARTATEAA